MKPSLSQHDALLQKLEEVVLANLDNEQFGVEDLASEVGMSRSHLHRTLKRLKGQSISQFIREIRLNEAMKLIQDDAATISEIAYQVGFNSSSYFHKCFLEQYGYPPGEVKKGTPLSVPTPSPIAEPASEESVQKGKKGLPKLLLPIAVGLVLVLAGVFVVKQMVSNEESISPKSIAVLPLKHISGNPEQEYLAVGMHDAIIGALGQLSAIRVISRTSTLRYRQTQMSLPEIAQELGVEAMVEGSIYGRGDSVRIQLQLIGTAPRERQLWAKEYHQNLRHILAQQSDMVRNIAQEIHVTITPAEESQLANTPQVHPDAYKAYMKGMFYWDKLTEEDLNKAMHYFELALEIDPNYALAYSGISLVWVGRMQQGLTSYFEGGSNIKIADIKTRLEALDRDIPEIHYVVGTKSCWVDWDYETAERELKRAIALNPNHSSARAYLSHVLNIRHKPDEAMEHIEMALDLDPFNPLFQALYGMDMLYARQFDQAIETLSKTLETAPTDPVALSTLRTAYHMKQMYPEALEIWETSYAAKGDQEAVEALMRGNREGGYSGALQAVAELLIERSKTKYVTPWQIGTLYTRAGMKEEAITWLEKAYEAHDSNMPYIGIDPIFDILRDDPRFLNLLERMKLS